MTELALDSELTLDQRDCLTTVKASAESLLGILNDILDFSKIESRKLELESVPFALRDAVDEVLKPLAVKAHQKGLELIVDIGVDVPAAVVGDPVRLRQVLANLIGNAIKFTEQGHVLLEIREEERQGNRAVLHFRVADTGIGIPPEKHAAIFEAFSQADGSTTRRFGGTGLGLTISATLVNLMKGRIWLESEPGAGSSFHFTASYDTVEALPVPAVNPLLEDLPVLIVDDNPINRRILHEQLTRWRMKPTAVDGGQAAMEALTTAQAAGHPFLLVLLDANMPDIDGFGVAGLIAARPELAGATVMMLTSSGQYGDAARCRELGISAYLTKPVRGTDLFNAILRVIEPDRRAPAAARSALPDAPARRVKILLAEDNIVNQRVAVGLLTKRGHDVTVAANGLEALAAIEREQFDVVLMDVQMPEMGGFEATTAIRARERRTGGHLRIVAMTAHAMTGDRERCLEVGMDGYLSKPIDRQRLFAAVEEREAAPAQAPAAAPINREQALQRLGGDEALFADVIRLFLEDCPVQLSALKDAIDARDAAGIRATAHTLKGSAGSLAATRVSNAARTMEQLGAEGKVAAAAVAWADLASEAAALLDSLRQMDAVSE
jgi:CheY-like chemotaxis protein/HPt (histidine-containing phosphotransfer) domain-containing protein